METELRYAVNWRIDDAGLRFIADREAEGGAILHAYDDRDPKHAPIKPGDPVRGTLTIGYGHTRTVKPGMRITDKEALELLRTDIREAESLVHRYVRVPITQCQYNALVSIVFNVGPGRLPGSSGPDDKGKSGIIVLTTGRPSSLLESLNDGKYDVAATWFTAWKATKGFEFGLFRRRIAEMLMFMGLPWLRAYLACTSLQFTMAQAIKLAKEELADINGMKAADPPKRDVELAPAPLPDSPPPTLKDALDGIPTQLPGTGAIEDEDELFLDTPAAPETDAKGSPPVSEPPSPSSQAAVPSQPNSSSSKLESPAPVPNAPSSPPGPVSSLPPPKLPDPPIPIGQQTSAVDAARKSEDWSASAKSMVYSRRFWGLLLVVGGRGYMLWTGSNAALGAVSDPIVTEMFSGFMVMMVGEIVQHWGSRKATRPLK